MPKKMLTLKSNDNDETFEIEEEVAIQSIAIKNMVEDDSATSVIPLHNVGAKTLALVIEYLKQHAESSNLSNKDLKNFDKKFLKEMDMATISDLIVAGYYLDIQSLIDLCSDKMATEIAEMTVEEVRSCFGIQKDVLWTLKEERELRKEYQWAHEGIDPEI